MVKASNCLNKLLQIAQYSSICMEKLYIYVLVFTYFHSWKHDVAVSVLSRSMKLLYIGPG